MKSLGVSVLILGLAACSGMPDVTRTGKVANVVVRDGLTPKTVTVSEGDEVRWVNQRTGTVRVEFVDPLAEGISCNDGFQRFLGIGTDQAANLVPNATASLCFNRPGEKRYVVRMEAMTPSGEQYVSGRVNVE